MHTCIRRWLATIYTTKREIKMFRKDMEPADVLPVDLQCNLPWGCQRNSIKINKNRLQHDYVNSPLACSQLKEALICLSVYRVAREPPRCVQELYSYYWLIPSEIIMTAQLLLEAEIQLKDARALEPPARRRLAPEGAFVVPL